MTTRTRRKASPRLREASRVVVKIGSSLLVEKSTGRLHRKWLQSLAREIGSRNITVNAVAPGFIDTDMTRALPEEQRKHLLEQIPMARLGDVKDIANAVAFLASDEASYITGETLHVNGGMYM